MIYIPLWLDFKLEMRKTMLEIAIAFTFHYG